MKSVQPSEPVKEIVKQEKTSPEILLPLTDEERAVNASAVILNQPDFVADVTFFRSGVVGGGGGSMRIARKVNKYRQSQVARRHVDNIF
jgi:hypothetical protein